MPIFPGEQIDDQQMKIVLRNRYRQLRNAVRQDVIAGTVTVGDEDKRLREMRLLRSIGRVLRINTRD